MNKRKIFEIVKFNVEKNVQNKGFVILNIIMCLIIIVSVNLKNIGNILDSHDISLFEEDYRIEVIDETGIAYDFFENEFKDNEMVELKFEAQNNYTKDNIDDNVIIVEYKLDDSNNLITKFITKEGMNDDQYNKLLDITTKIRNQVLALNLGIEVSKLEIINQTPEIERVMLGVDAENSDFKDMIKTFSVVIVYMVLIFVLSAIANEIATEKISKSIEYVLTSVDEKEYLLAKVLSITITIIIQLVYSLIYYMIGNAINNLFNISAISNVESNLQSIDMSIVSYILVLAGYLIFTVFFLSMIQAAISSKTTSITEASNTTMLLLMIVVVLYFISLGAIGPYIKVTTFMYILSCIPIVSTFFVPSMMIIGQATTLQIIISFILLIICTPIVFNICAKKFKYGILDYTTKNKKSKNKKEEKSVKEIQENLMKKNDVKRFAFVLGFSLLLWFIFEQIGGLVIPYLVNSIFSVIISEKSITWIYYSIISIISFIIPAKLIISYTDKEYRLNKKVDFKRGIKYILVGFCFIILIQYLEMFIVDKIGSDYQVLTESMIVSAKDSLLDKILFFIGIAVIPGIFEELLLRKAILGYGKKFGNYFALLTSAIIFGLLHMNFQQGIFAVLIGIVFGIIMLKTGDIRLTISLHILNNGFVALSTLFSENEIALFIIEIITIILAVIGGILFIGYLIKNKGLKIEKEKFKQEYKMLFLNYTFDLVIVLFVVLTIVSENMLRLQ